MTTTEKKSAAFLTLCFFIASLKIKTMINEATKQKFRALTKPAFAAVKSGYGIDPTIALVQAALESNWGVSELATEGKNIFSLTPGSKWLSAVKGNIPMSQVPAWSVLGAAVVYLPTKEYSNRLPKDISFWEFPGDVVDKKPTGNGGTILTVNRAFRKYNSWEESARDWADHLTNMRQYADAVQAAKDGNMERFAVAITQGGYATDPSYIKNLLQVSFSVQHLPLDTVA